MFINNKTSLFKLGLIALTTFSLSSTSMSLSADEGMWQPYQLPALKKELKEMGIKINPTKLSELTEFPMNAIVSLGGCSASFVSPQGLVATNHHCAYGSIQYNSTPENNLLESGFLAKELDEELQAAPGSRVYVTEAVTDVSDEVNAQVGANLKGKARYDAIESAEKKLVADCEKEDGYRCKVSSFHGGLEYFLIKQLEIRDVRLAHFPSKAIGKYGGDIDNWIWPRHTGDYAFYRAYVGKDGKPADFSKDNVPFRPKGYLRTNPNGVKEGDFIMVAGYPGRTNRYRLASEVKNTIDWNYPTRIKEFNAWLDNINELAVNDEDTKIKYASLVAGLNNAEKNNRGMLDGFAKSDVVERKLQLQEDLQNWIDGSPERKAKYSATLNALDNLVAQTQADQVRSFYYDFMAQRSSLLGSAKTLYRLAKEKQKPDAERQPEIAPYTWKPISFSKHGYQDRDLPKIENDLRLIDRRSTIKADKNIWKNFIRSYARNVPTDQHNPIFDKWFGINENKIDESRLNSTLDQMYENTELFSLEKRLAWMDKDVKAFEESNDPFIQLAVALYESDLEQENSDKEIEGQLNEIRPQYMQAIIDYKTEKDEPIYADANSTLRVTVGNVKGYSPADAVYYTPFTTLNGILQKDTGVEPFNSPENQLDAINAGNFGSYNSKDLDSVPVNFLGTLDITGGNSGSATLNNNAEFVGLVFDGNYESINSDWDFNQSLVRSIHVDIRYMLWVMDELYGADNLLKEMGVK